MVPSYQLSPALTVDQRIRLRLAIKDDALESGRKAKDKKESHWPSGVYKHYETMISLFKAD